MSSKLKTQEERDAIRQFCPCCFADDIGGSWGVGTVGGYCMNCGNGSTIAVPAWAVESIREQASWVGKRYYPNDEDKQAREERTALLALVKEFPGRSADESAEEPGHWVVKQLRPNGARTMTYVAASSATEALERARTILPYVTAEALAAGKETA
jgi:hypothetical protein